VHGIIQEALSKVEAAQPAGGGQIEGGEQEGRMGGAYKVKGLAGRLVKQVPTTLAALETPALLLQAAPEPPP